MARMEPSEKAHLVLDYLQEKKCYDAYETFLSESPDLQEYRELLDRGIECRTTYPFKSLSSILDQYYRKIFKGEVPLSSTDSEQEEPSAAPIKTSQKACFEDSMPLIDKLPENINIIKSCGSDVTHQQPSKSIKRSPTKSAVSERGGKRSCKEENLTIPASVSSAANQDTNSIHSIDSDQPCPYSEETVSCVTRPNVTHVCHPSINSSRLVACSEEEGEEEENEGLETFEDQEEMEDHEHEKFDMGMRIFCRCIQIGSFKVRGTTSCFLQVSVNDDGFMFSAHTVTDVNEQVTIKLNPADIVSVLGHFGRCLPTLFIYATPHCGARIRDQLRMNQKDGPYFYPEGKDEEQTLRIIFIIECLTDDHRVFLRHIFPGDGILQEIDLKTANQILVKSAPPQGDRGNVSNRFH